MCGWAGCILHKSRGRHSHRPWYKRHSRSCAKHSSHPWYLCSSLFYANKSYLLSIIMNISRAVLTFYTFLLFLKLPSTVLNTHLTLTETLCGLDSRDHYPLGFYYYKHYLLSYHRVIPITLISFTLISVFFISLTSYYIYMSIFLLKQVLWHWWVLKHVLIFLHWSFFTWKYFCSSLAFLQRRIFRPWFDLFHPLWLHTSGHYSFIWLRISKFWYHISICLAFCETLFHCHNYKVNYDFRCYIPYNTQRSL